MNELDDLAEKIGRASATRSQRHARAMRFVKGFLIIGGTAIIAIAQFLAIPEGGKIGFWSAAGIGGAVLVVVGSLFVLFLDDDDNSEILENSRAAVAEAQEMREAIDNAVEVFGEYQEELNRLIQLYLSMSIMKETIKSIIDVDRLDEVGIVEALLESAKRSLQRALGFKLEHIWTLCVYRAKPEEGKVVLKCITQARSIDCSSENARVWPAGVGAAGAAYSRGIEVIVPDLTAPELGNLYNLGTMAKPEDDERYRSIAAVPIKIAPDPAEPWGVVIATSDQPNHFYLDHEPGVRAVEAARALAGMIELALKVRANGGATGIGDMGKTPIQLQ